MHLVPAPAVRLMKRRVLSRPGVNSRQPNDFLFHLLFSFSLTNYRSSLDSPVKGFAIHRSLNSFSLSFLSLVKNCNHKGLGIYYLLSAFIFGISGTLISVLIRIELYSSGNRIISPENQNFYNISITLHSDIY